MSIIENISMWGGIAGVVVAVFSVIILYLTRSNIIDLLDKDAIMYDKVYEVKKNAFCAAFDVLDYYEIYGIDVKASKQFVQKAKSAYNDLVCTANTPKVYDEFYRLTLNPNTTQISIQDIANFKSLCREDLGLHVKRIKIKQDVTPLVSQIPTVSPTQNKARPVVPTQPAQPAQPKKVAQKPVQAPAEDNE